MYLIITGVKKIVRFTEEFTCRGLLNPGSSVINNGCGEIWKGQCSKRGEAVSKLFIEKRESYLIWTIYHTSFPEDNVFIRWCLISRFLYNREKLEIKDPRKNKTALIYCVFCFVCLFVCLFRQFWYLFYYYCLREELCRSEQRLLSTGAGRAPLDVHNSPFYI